MGFKKDITEFLASAVQEQLATAADCLGGLADTVTDIVSKTPYEWHNDVYQKIRTVSDTAIVPIAIGIMSLIICYDLIQTCIDRNNFKEFDTSVFFRFLVKSWAAIYLVNNAKTLTHSLIYVGANMAQTATDKLLSGNGGVFSTIENVRGDSFLESLMDLEIGQLLTLWLLLTFVYIIIIATVVIVYIVCVGRMIEIMIYVCSSPIPLATLTNREWGSIGTSFIRNVLAISLQAFFIVIIMGVYILLFNTNVVGSINSAVSSTSLNTQSITQAMLEWMAYSVVCCFTLLKTSSISKSICGAH